MHSLNAYFGLQTAEGTASSGKGTGKRGKAGTPTKRKRSTTGHETPRAVEALQVRSFLLLLLC